MHVVINAWFWDNLSVGSGQYLRYLLPALLEQDDSLTLTLVSPKPFDPPPDLGERVQAVVKSTPLRQQGGNLAKVWFEQVTFPRACRQLGADVAHVPYFGSPLSPPVPTVVTIHDVIPLVIPEYRRDWKARLYTSLVAAAAPQADLILADSEASQRDILARLNVSAEKVRVVYLAPAPHFQVAETWAPIAAVIEKYHLPDEFVLYLGGYDIRKNVAALLHAYTWVVHTLGDAYPLVLAGKLPMQSSPLHPDPLQTARALGIEEYIVTPGWIAEEDKPALYGAATVFVYPSRYEGFGLPILEAMACGTPVITTTAASLPELAGGAAFQVDPDDVRHIAAPIIRLCTEEHSVDDLAHRGLEQVAKFTWQKTARETLQAYRDVWRTRA